MTFSAGNLGPDWGYYGKEVTKRSEFLLASGKPWLASVEGAACILCAAGLCSGTRGIGFRTLAIQFIGILPVVGLQLWCYTVSRLYMGMSLDYWDSHGILWVVLAYCVPLLLHILRARDYASLPVMPFLHLSLLTAAVCMDVLPGRQQPVIISMVTGGTPALAVSLVGNLLLSIVWARASNPMLGCGPPMVLVVSSLTIMIIVRKLIFFYQCLYTEGM